MSPSRPSGPGICVVGIGATTPLGKTSVSTAAALRAGVSAFAEHPFVLDCVGEPMIVALAPDVALDATGTQRLLQMSLPAAREALQPVAELSRRDVKVPVVIGLPERRPGFSFDLATELALGLRDSMNAGRPPAHPEVLPRGHAAGLLAIEAGCQAIRRGEADFCLVGGIDSYIEPRTLYWLERCDQLHRPDNAWGFVPGEAAGFCLLSSSDAARRYGLEVLGQLLGIASSQETKRIKTRAVCTGEGLTDAVRRAISESGGAQTLIDETICDLNGETYRADEFGFMLARTSEYFRDTSSFTTPADCWGDVGAASGPLFLALAVAASRRGYAKGPVTLLWASSEGGDRAAALFHAEVQDKGIGRWPSRSTSTG